MDKEQTRLLLNAKLQMLIEEHRDLDEAVHRMLESPVTDIVSIQRLKKRKLTVKDKIEQLKKMLLPDILA